jgi:hypothetical protein
MQIVSDYVKKLLFLRKANVLHCAREKMAKIGFWDVSSQVNEAFS